MEKCERNEKGPLQISEGRRDINYNLTQSDLKLIKLQELVAFPSRAHSVAVVNSVVILLSFAGLCPDWETWDPVKPVENATEAMQLADDWLGIPQVRFPLTLLLQCDL